MPQLGYSLGRDVAVDIITPMGKLRIPKVTKFTSKTKLTSTDITALSGSTDTLQTPKGWEGQFDAERMDSTLDDFWAQWEDNYFNGIDTSGGTITETIEESNGSVSVYRYENVSFHLTNPGDKEGDKTIKQTMTFTANRRKKVA